MRNASYIKKDRVKSERTHCVNMRKKLAKLNYLKMLINHLIISH